MPIHSRRHVADDAILETYGARVISTSDGDSDEEIKIGISIAGWDIKTSSSSIGNEREMETLNDLLQKHMGDSRRLALPEIVFANAFVSLTHPCTSISQEEKAKGSLTEIKITAEDALEDWASCHSYLNVSDKDERSNFTRGVSIIKSIDAKLWEERQAREWHTDVQQGQDSSAFGKGSAAYAMNRCSTEFFYDWTFSSPYMGTVLMNDETKSWVQIEASEINFSLLTDQSVPILYFDDVNLYEDDMHDNGYVSLRCKIRVMPNCFFILLSLFVRVDHVMIRVKEVRLFSQFNSNDGGIKLVKDVAWKECAWATLPTLGLPSHVGSWRVEEKGMEQRIHQMIRKIPSVALPDGIYEHSTIQIEK